MLAADRAAFRASSTARCFCITKGHGYEEGEGGKEENNTKAQNRNECVSWTNKTDSQVTGIHSLALLFVVLCCTQFSFLMQTTSKKLLHTHTHTHRHMQAKNHTGWWGPPHCPVVVFSNSIQTPKHQHNSTHKTKQTQSPQFVYLVHHTQKKKERRQGENWRNFRQIVDTLFTDCLRVPPRIIQT